MLYKGKYIVDVPLQVTAQENSLKNSICLGSSGCGELNWPFICSKKDPGCIADPKVVPNKRSGRDRVRDNEVELQMVHHTTACRGIDQSSSPNLLPLE